MILYPAIDLKDGACVRLLQGAMDKVDVFNDDPAAQARSFAEAGAEWLHVVDLDGAIAGSPVNADAVAEVLAAVAIPIQLGGGVRNLATVEKWLDRGVARVILGTVAVEEPELVRTACTRHPGRIAVAIDARDGRVAVAGWTELADVTPADLARRSEDAGAAAIIYTDIARDGMMTGVNVAATAALADVLSVPQGALVRRALSELRREYGNGGMSLPECANRIRDIVEQFRLRPVDLPDAPSPITADDLGVVCYQVVLPARGPDA